MREMNAPAIHASRTAIPLKRQAIRGLVIGLAAAVLMAYLGAMGTWQVPFGQRLAYWMVAILPGSVLGLAVTVLVRGWGRLADHRWQEMAVVAVLVSLPHSFVVIVATALFFGLDAITLATVAQFWLGVLVVSLALTAINYLALASELQGAAENPPLPEPTNTAQPVMPSATPASVKIPELLASKLPPHLQQAQIAAIEAEDHYVRIHTDLGSALLLMRMADACALLEDVPGARVHRSWWVARDVVQQRTLVDGRMQLTLVGGLSVPVSRAMQPVLKAGGW